MSTIRRLEGKRDFLMQIIASLKRVPWHQDTISNLLNISSNEIEYINQEFNIWKEEQLEKKIGAAEVLEQIKINNPKYRLNSQKYNLSTILGISMEELTELEKILEDTATIK